MKVVIANNIEEAAKAIRQFAELTAKHSQNWDNFEQICLQMLQTINKKEQK